MYESGDYRHVIDDLNIEINIKFDRLEIILNTLRYRYNKSKNIWQILLDFFKNEEYYILFIYSKIPDDELNNIHYDFLMQLLTTNNMLGYELFLRYPDDEYSNIHIFEFNFDFNNIITWKYLFNKMHINHHIIDKIYTIIIEWTDDIFTLFLSTIYNQNIILKIFEHLSKDYRERYLKEFKNFKFLNIDKIIKIFKKNSNTFINYDNYDIFENLIFSNNDENKKIINELYIKTKTNKMNNIKKCISNKKNYY